MVLVLREKDPVQAEAPGAAGKTMMIRILHPGVKIQEEAANREEARVKEEDHSNKNNK